jgi:hypothetical protein
VIAKLNAFKGPNVPSEVWRAWWNEGESSLTSGKSLFWQVVCLGRNPAQSIAFDCFVLR